jgi:hypothetical protein
MSRSYKRSPVCRDNNQSKKWGKRQANKKIRKTRELSGKSNDYKKAFESWNICDQRIYADKKKWFRGTIIDKQDLNHWEKWYVRK